MMTMSRRRLSVLMVMIALYLCGIGFLSGMVVERMRFDGRRAAVLASLSAAQARLHAHLMHLERRTESRHHFANDH